MNYILSHIPRLGGRESVGIQCVCVCVAQTKTLFIFETKQNSCVAMSSALLHGQTDPSVCIMLNNVEQI